MRATSLFAGIGIGLAAGFVAGAAYMKNKMSEAIDEIVHDEIQEFMDNWNREMAEEAEEDEEETEEIKDYTPYNSLHANTNNKPSPSTLFRDRAMEHPEEPDEETDILEENPIKKKEDDDMKDPKLISEDKFDEDTEFTKETLLYYTEDDTLTDEDEHEIENQLEYVGEAMDKFGFRDNDDELSIHVRNFEKKTDYEIIKVYAAYRD